MPSSYGLCGDRAVIYSAERRALSVALLGDSLVTRRLSPHAEPRYHALRSLLFDADVRITNLEMLLHDFEHPPAAVPGGSYMRADPTVANELHWLGVNVVCTANNHAYDFGEAGLLTHLAHLDASPLVHAGAGVNLAAARSPRFLDTANGRVAVIGVTSSGPSSLRAEHQWRDGLGRPGANMLRYTTEITVDRELFDALRRLRDGLDLVPTARLGAHLRFADHSFGASSVPDAEDSFWMADLHDRFQYPCPDGYRLVLGDRISRRLVPVAEDVEENLQRIRDARRMADWVIVTMHSHESGATADEPSSLLRDFARHAIEAGADVVHGHGPHRDRGIEMHHGRPIFYSIGHFIVQNDTIERVPRDNLLRQGLEPWTSTPADFFDARAGREHEEEFLGAAASESAWRDVIAVVDFDHGRLVHVGLRPIDLGFGRPRAQRGRPVLAEGDVATAALEHIRALSEPFGTKVVVEGDAASIVL